MSAVIAPPYQTIREIELADLSPNLPDESSMDRRWSNSIPLAGYIRETLAQGFDHYFYLPSLRELAMFFDLPLMLVKEAFQELERQGFDSTFANADERILIWDSLLNESQPSPHQHK